MSLVPIFVAKSQFGPSNFFCLNLLSSVNGTVMPLEGVSRVSS